MKDPSISRTMRQSDQVVDDDKLSMAAKGTFLVLDLLGKHTSVAQLADFTSDAPVALYRFVAELRDAGYVTLEGDIVAVRSREAFGVLQSAGEAGNSETKGRSS